MDRDRTARGAWQVFGEAFRLGARPASRNQGSKPGYRHKLNPRRQLQRDFLYGQAAADGHMSQLSSGQKCVPPHIKFRQPLEPARPLNAAERTERYLGPGGDELSLTPAQRRRMVHKLNHAMAKARKA